MAEAELEKTLDISKEKLFQVVVQYEKYPEFVDGMKHVITEKNADGSTKAIYDLTTMGKDIRYTLNLKDNFEAGTVSWSLVESDFFKKNNGGWNITSTGTNECKVRYWLDVDFKIPVPGFILKGLVKNSIPGVVASFLERAKNV